MRLVFASLFATMLFAAPLFAGAAAVDHPAVPLPVITAAPAPITHVLAPAVKLPSPTPTPVSGPPANPATPTVWLKPIIGNQMILSNVSESMTPQGNHGCMLFTITATLNPTDAVTLLGFYNENEVMREARVYAPPSVIYDLTNAVMKSYSASSGPSGSSVHLTLNAQKTIVTAGGNITTSDCTAG